jgi:ubiquinone biosynthesis protein
MIDLTQIPQFARNIGRVGEIVGVLAKYGLAGWLSHVDRKFVHRWARQTPLGTWTSESREARIRLALTELGTTFIKLGQVMSTRRDLVGPELADELSSLQSHVPADPFYLVRTTIEDELKRPLAELFAEFEETALASASIAQVHRARLHDGRRVVVKVRHRDIENRVISDLAIMAELAGLLELYVPDVRPYRPIAVVDEFKRTIARELDFRRELRHLQLFRAAFEKDATVRFPEPYPTYSTGLVLTMEYLDGAPFTKPEDVRLAGGDLDELTNRGAKVFLDMIFREGFFHADPHPGNILYLPVLNLKSDPPGGTLGLIDFGMVGRLDTTLRDKIEQGVTAAIRQDAAALTEIIVDIGDIPPHLDQTAMQADVAEQLAFYYGMPLDQFRLGPALNDLTEAIRRYQVVLPASLSSLLRVLVILEGMGRHLSPKFNLVPLLEPYARQFSLKRYSPRRMFGSVSKTINDWHDLLAVVPRQITLLLRSMNRRELTVRLSHQHLEPSVNRLVTGLLASAIFLGSSIMWALRAPPLIFGELSIFGVLGFGVSTVLSFRLYRAIQHSGRLEE